MARNCKPRDEHNLTSFLLDAGSKAYRTKLEIPGSCLRRGQSRSPLSRVGYGANSGRFDGQDVRKAKTPIIVTPLDTIAGKERSNLKKLGRRERNAEETRLRILRAAFQLFADRGFQSATVEDITRSADVGKGTFFNYFDCKEQVLAVIPELQLRHVAEAVEAACTGKQSIQSILRRMFHNSSRELGHSAQWARTAAASFLVGDSVREIVRHQMCEGRTAAATVIAEGQRRGEIDPKLDSTDVALHMQEVLLGTALLWSLHENSKLSAWVEESFWLFWRSVAAKKVERES